MVGVDPRLIVHRHDTTETAMAAIEANQHRSVIVVDDHNVVVGTLSDGDVRKVILDRRLLSTPVHQVMNSNFIALGPHELSRAKALFDRMHIFLIPVIDDRGRLLKVLKAYE